MAWLIKCLPHQQEDRSLSSQNPCKVRGVVIAASYPSMAQLVAPGSVRDIISKNKVESNLGQ